MPESQTQGGHVDPELGVLVPDVDEDEAQEQQGIEQFMTYVVATETYAVPLEAVQEIIRFQRVTPVPDVAPHIAGVINLRGTVVPVVDVRVRLGLERRDADGRTCIIVVQFRDMSVGLLVDTVSEVVKVPLNGVEVPPRSGATGDASGMIRGLVRVDDEVKILVDIETLLFGGSLANGDPMAEQNGGASDPLAGGA